MQPPFIIVIAEHFEGRLKPVTFELVAFAKKIRRIEPGDIKVLILGQDAAKLGQQIAATCALDTWVVEVPELVFYNGEVYQQVLVQLLAAQKPSYICCAHSSQGLDFAPALADGLNAACITGIEDVIAADQGPCFLRPIQGGKIRVHVVPATVPAVLTVQPGIFQPAESASGTDSRLEIKRMPCPAQRSRAIAVKKTDVDTSALTEADVIVAAGQGVGEKENLDFIYELAALFPKAAVAGSRIVCDLGWLEYKCQVGITGATVSPRLYIACGISGALQHVAAMREAGFIVAINTDPAAAIFQVADICVVEDLTTFIPTLLEEYEKFKSGNK